MILLNWLPEIFLLFLLFAALIVMNFRLLTYRSLSVFVASFSIVGLGYFLLREDLAYFESPVKLLVSDSLSHFGRALSLMSLIVFSLGFHFHRRLSFEAKQSSNLFLIFYSVFTMALFQFNSLVLFLVCSLGIYLTTMNLVLIESGKDARWFMTFRQRMLPIALWGVMVSFLFVLGSHLFGSIYLSDWISEFSKYAGSEVSLFVFGFLVLLVSVIPIGGLQYVGNAPLGISIFSFSLFLILTAFWFRLGIPFFSVAPLLNKVAAQALLSIVVGVFTLRYAWYMIHTREHYRWFSSALPTVVGLSLFAVLLPGEQALPAFYCIALSMLFSFALISHAFLTEDYRHKFLLVFAVVALVGMPPLILGEQFYRVVHEAVASGNVLAGALMTISWFVLTLGVTQKISKILLVRSPVQTQRKILKSELFFIVIYLACVISLTIFRVEFVAFLNEHPVLNLW